jgi:hypothetical protein
MTPVTAGAIRWREPLEEGLVAEPQGVGYLVMRQSYNLEPDTWLPPAAEGTGF